MTKLLLTPHDAANDTSFFHKYRLRDNLDMQKALEATYPAINFDWVTDLQTLHAELHGEVPGRKPIRDGSTPTFLYLDENFDSLVFEAQKQNIVDVIFRHFRDVVDTGDTDITVYFRYFHVCPANPEKGWGQPFIKLKYEGLANV